MKKHVLIVAGGSGQRMKTQIPKQFLLLDGKPVLMHTISAFYSYDSSISIYLVLPEKQMEYWQKLCKKHQFPISHTPVAGGKTRFHSVKNGLAAVKTGGLIAIHDGVRPLVSRQTIENCFRKAEEKQACIPVVPLIDSIRKINDKQSIALDRKNYRLVQTPQVFDLQLITNAYSQNYCETFTDDASVAETFGAEIELTNGNSENIKITTALDLAICETFLLKSDK